METPNEKPLAGKIVNRKDFFIAAAGATAFLGMTGRAKATGTQAYLDSVETFSSAQTFMGSACFESGYPWIDVTGPLYGASPSASAATNTAAINNALAHAIVSSGTGGTGNYTVYIPPGTYYINGTIQPPNSASNFIIMGAGPQSSILQWAGTGGSSMLKLINSRNVVIRDIGLGGALNSNMPSYGIEIHRDSGWTSGTPYPEGILVDNVYLGIGGATSCLGVAIGYTAAAGYDTIPAGNGTFRDVYIYHAATAYKFGTAYGHSNTIIRGAVNYSANAAFDTTPGTNSTSGGSYSIFSTGTSGSTPIFNVGQSLGLANSVFGLQSEPDYQLINTPTSLQAQTMAFFGGVANIADTATNTIVYNSTGGALEFHGFSLDGGNNPGTYHYGGSAAIGWFGGATETGAVQFNGPYQLHSSEDVNSDAGNFTNLGSGIRQGFGRNGHLAGSALGVNGNVAYTAGAAAGSTPTITVMGSDIAGVITITPGSGATTGTLVQVTFAIPFTTSATAPVIMLLPAEANSAGILTSIYTQTVGYTAFQLCTATVLNSTKKYQWSYLVIG